MSVTRGTLKTRCLQRGNTSGYVNTAVNDELSGLVDTSTGKIHNLLTELYEDYFMRKSSFLLTANQGYYPLPPDFLKMRAVFYLTPSSSYPNDLSLAQGIELRRMDATETQQTWGTVSVTSVPYGYSIEDSKLIIAPTPSATSNYIGLKYIPQYVPPANDATPIEFAVAFGWDEWIVNDVVIQMRLKSMMPVQELVAERQTCEERIRIQAKNRNASQPPRVRNTGWNYGSHSAPWGQFAIR